MTTKQKVYTFIKVLSLSFVLYTLWTFGGEWVEYVVLFDGLTPKGHN